MPAHFHDHYRRLILEYSRNIIIIHVSLPKEVNRNFLYSIGPVARVVIAANISSVDGYYHISSVRGNKFFRTSGRAYRAFQSAFHRSLSCSVAKKFRVYFTFCTLPRGL